MAIKTYVTGNSTFTAADNDSQVIGAAGEQKVKILAGVTNVSLDANIEKIDLAGNLANYKFVDAPEGIKILNADGATVALIPSLNQAATIAFADGSAAFTQSSTTGAFSLGSKVISTVAAAITTADVGAFDITNKSTVVTASTGGTSTGGSSTAVVGTQLKITQDDLVGTANNDLFQGVIVNNANTFQSGDAIDGGAGVDTLQVELGNSSSFAIRATTQNVEKFVATVQSTNGLGSSGTNNVDTTGQKATVDAEKMVGVREFWNSDSRADLKIEDIRIDVPGQTTSPVTKDVTIGLRNTDPGSIDPYNVLTGTADHKVDYEVYFSPESLRPGDATSTSKISLSLTNPMRLEDGFISATPLVAGKDPSPYTDVSFFVDDVKKTLSFDLATVKTYDQLEATLNASIQAAIKADPTLTGLTLVKDGTETFSAKSGDIRTAPKYTLSLDKHILSTVSLNGAQGGWGTTGGLPNANAFAAEIRAAGTQSTNPLITSTIVLDNVGREDEAGTLTIGSMSTHGGVERFEIIVENNADNAYTGTQSGSWLGHMQSTSNTLQEVKVVNGTDGITNPDYLYLGTNMDQAGNNLTVMQDWPGSLDRAYNQITPMYSNGYRTTVAADGDTQQHVSNLLNPNGLVDVRLFDASEMKGNVFVGASVTEDTIRKYQNLVDTLPNTTAAGTDSADDVAFKYLTGDASDSVNLQIDGTVAASNSRVVTGRHDFSFLVETGAGNDNIRVGLVNGLNGNTENWYDNQDINNNVTINAGSGDDTIRKPGAGDVRIDAGSGNDTVYTDNTGKQTIVTRAANGTNGTTPTTSNAMYAFNAVDSNGGTAADGGYNVFDLRSQVVASVSAVNAQVTVNYLGMAKTVYIANSNNQTSNVAITDLSVNQAIKDAINNDAVLNKLLIAQDGPGRTLLVSSLIDGADGAGDLAITFGSTPLTAAQTAIVTPALTLFGATNANYAALTDGYAVTFAQDNNGASITGAVSNATSDNVVLPGTGNDVIVLGTTSDGTTFAGSSNETVVYETTFGDDAVVNFDATGSAIDHFDFTKLGGSTYATNFSTNSSVNVQTFDVKLANAVTTIQNLYNTANTAAQTHVYVAVSTHNIGSVYTITDPAGANNATAVLQGTIDLAYTPWGSLGSANFVDSSVANYHLIEGPNTLNGAIAVVPGATLASSAASVSEGSTVTFNVTNATPGTLAYTLAGTATNGVDYTTPGVLTVAANGTGSLTVATIADNLTDGTVATAETLILSAMGLSSSVTINDTSLTPAPGSVTSVIVTAANATPNDATLGNVTYSITPLSTYTFNVAGFAAGDKLAFANSSAIAVNNTSGTDGILDVAGTLNGNQVTIHLTGVANALDGQAFNAASFNTAFGAGSLV